MNSTLYELLEIGTLKVARAGQPHVTAPYAMRRLVMDDLDAVFAVQQFVHSTLEEPSLFYPGTRELLGKCLSDRGLAVGTFVDGSLVGFRSIFYPGHCADNLGYDIGLHGDALDLVAYLDRTAVEPAYRGNRLQIRMTAHAIRLAIETRQCVHLFSTVAPTNFASMADKFTIGMQVVRTTKKYLDYWRHLFYRNLVAPLGIEAATAAKVGGDDFATQLSLVEEQGFVAYGLERRGEHAPMISFARPGRPCRLR
jgi:hypothetical protein